MIFREFIDRNFIKKPRFRRFVTKLIYGKEDQRIQLFGASLCVNSLAENGYFRAWKKSQNSSLFRDEVGVLISLAMIMDNGDTFVDIGANIGIYSTIMHRASNYYKNCHFYAFEPNPDTFSRLEKNMKGTKTAIVNKALSDRKEKVKFLEGAVSHMFTDQRRQSVYNIAEESISVECDRLDSYDLQGDSLILKIDVEGREWPVLQGARNLFEHTRIKAVYLDGYEEKEKIISFLKYYNFVFFNGRTLVSEESPRFSLLAIHSSQLDKCNAEPQLKSASVSA